MRALCAVLSACIGLVALVFLLNAFDESLGPEASRRGEGPQPATTAGRNAYNFI